MLTLQSDAPTRLDRSRYRLRPILFDVATAHRDGLVVYDADGTATLHHPEVAARNGGVAVRVPLDRQRPLVLSCLIDLGKALSSTSNSPRLEDGSTLREAYEREYAAYVELAVAA